MMTEEDDPYTSSSVKMKLPFYVFFKDVRNVFKLDELGSEIAQIALPAALALTADPIASLVDTAFIGQIGSVELAAVGVSIALFNQVSRIAIFPLVSVTTSFVAEEDTIGRVNSEEKESEYLETGLCANNENKELIPQKGFTYAKPCTTILDIKVTRCSGSPSLISNARRLSGV
ncbi:hypothetical protein COLO4_07592 [Corchorus olitorius]|uniref:Multi antimicrobial extrusion protein n=1 Tax=Corchorus olitorius TaxID=93759 RepID=A0A1R3KJ82_9ROSI|nr:hypothetical protein COLO4_07592 [Corchorus olitorius]